MMVRPVAHPLLGILTGLVLITLGAASGADPSHGEKIPHYSSVEGFPVFQSHEYEMVVTYDNPTSKDVDAMAVVYLYYFDKAFEARTVHPSG